jgi:hypothetical protein
MVGGWSLRMECPVFILPGVPASRCPERYRVKWWVVLSLSCRSHFRLLFPRGIATSPRSQQYSRARETALRMRGEKKYLAGGVCDWVYDGSGRHVYQCVGKGNFLTSGLVLNRYILRNG